MAKYGEAKPRAAEHEAVSSTRPRIAVPTEQGEFSHQAEDAESPCVTGLGEPRCGCGLYQLDWAPAIVQAP